jgi:hypothetical protein
MQQAVYIERPNRGRIVNLAAFGMRVDHHKRKTSVRPRSSGVTENQFGLDECRIRRLPVQNSHQSPIRTSWYNRGRALVIPLVQSHK